jgi:hypothetical protein
MDHICLLTSSRGMHRGIEPDLQDVRCRQAVAWHGGAKDGFPIRWNADIYVGTAVGVLYG